MIRSLLRLASLAWPVAAASTLVLAQGAAPPASPAMPGQGTPPPSLVKAGATKKISDHVWVIPDFNVGGVPNVGIIVGSRGTLVVDTGLGPRNAQTVLAEVAKVSQNSELYLVATHYHPEHAGGSSAFPPSAKFIVGKVEQQDIDELGMGMMQRFAGMSALNADLLRGVTFRKPDVTFDREYALDLGGVRVTLRAAGSTHTRGDTSIFVEPDRVLFAGDIVLSHAYLAFSDTSSAATWVDVLGQLEALRPAMVVPSHGAMGDGTVLSQYRSLLSYMMGYVSGAKAAGRSVEETTAALTADLQGRYADWTAPARIAPAVRVMYAEAK